MLKVVIDTNLLIDGSSDFYNYSNRIIDAVVAGHVQAYANSATLRENKFIAPKKLSDPNYINKLNYFFDLVNQVESIDRLDVVEDPQDNKLLESAIAADADFLVTSDRHLLKIENYNGIKIVSPTEFWNIYSEDHGWVNWIKNFIQ